MNSHAKANSACRKAGMGECRECEAALLCRDFLRLGYSKLVVDPGVRLAYSADVARQRYTKKVSFCTQASVAKSSPAWPAPEQHM